MATQLVLLFRIFLPSLFVLLCSILLPGGVSAQEVVLRIPVTEEGAYRITYNELGYYGQPYGIDPKDIDPRQIHLYNRERDVAIHISGEEDGQFNPGDYTV